MWRADCVRRYAIPFRVIPDLGQGPKNRAHPSIKQRCHVLQQQLWASHQANGSQNVPEKSGSLSGKTGTFASE
jgi:hypothetical protein